MRADWAASGRLNVRGLVELDLPQHAQDPAGRGPGVELLLGPPMDVSSMAVLLNHELEGTNPHGVLGGRRSRHSWESHET